jgi:hypothetical protein
MSAVGGKAAQNVREKLSMEFVTAEVHALKNLINAAGDLPDLVLFDADAMPAPAPAPVQASSGFDSNVDPVEELRMLFGSAQ